jgi:transposase
LTTEYAKAILKEKRPSRRDIIENINDRLYDDEIHYDNLAKNCKNYFGRLDLNNNAEKIDEEKMKNFLKNCEKLNIEELCQKEKLFNLILDNYSVHHSAYVEQISEILNINLIFLPTYSPDLNPIEDVWRIIKKYVSNKFIKSGKDIVNLYISKFYEEVTNNSLYKNWLKEFMNICLKS